MKKTVLLFTSLLLGGLASAQPLTRTLVFKLQPQIVTAVVSCTKGSSDQSDTFQLNLKNQPKAQVLGQLMLENTQEVLALQSCVDFSKLPVTQTSEWIQYQAPAYPLAVPPSPMYNYQQNKSHWLLLKDLSASSENEPFYQAFVWQQGTWQHLPDFFKGLSFYGFEGQNMITGFYESGFFIKHTNQVKGAQLQAIKKEVWTDEQMIKPYTEEDAAVFEK